MQLRLYMSACVRLRACVCMCVCVCGVFVRVSVCVCIQFSRPSQQSQEPSCNSILDIASGVGVRAYCCHFIELLLHGRYTGFHFSPSGSQHGLSFFVVRLASRSLHGLSFFALNFASNSTYSFIVRRQAGISVATESCIFFLRLSWQN